MGAAAAITAAGRSLSEGLVPSLSDDVSARLVDFINQEMMARHIPGLSACLVHRDGHLLWSHNSGYANLESIEQVTFDHVQNIASISKTFTTVAAMQQVEAGLLDLDDDVNDYLPFELSHAHFPDPRLVEGDLVVTRRVFIAKDERVAVQLEPSLAPGEAKDVFRHGAERPPPLVGLRPGVEIVGVPGPPEDEPDAGENAGKLVARLVDAVHGDRHGDLVVGPREVAEDDEPVVVGDRAPQP